MLDPLTKYFTNTIKDFDLLFTGVFDGALEDEDIANLENYLISRFSIRPIKLSKNSQ